MSDEDSNFVAKGIEVHGFVSAFVDEGTEILEHGVNVQGSICGVYGESPRTSVFAGRACGRRGLGGRRRSRWRLRRPYPRTASARTIALFSPASARGCR
jgi:hypothetical protein